MLPPKKKYSVPHYSPTSAPQKKEVTMALIFSQTPMKRMTLPDSQLGTGSGRSKSHSLKAAPPPRTARREGKYCESDSSLQSYNCELGSSVLPVCSLQTANELLCKSLKDFRNVDNSISPVDCGVYTFQTGRETSIDVRIREDVGKVQFSASLHATTLSDVPSDKTRRRSGYSLRMTMVRLNSQLSQASCGGRIFACDGRFVFFQDFPISILNQNDTLHRELDQFILTTAAMSRGFS